jgi:hypothetical protein
MLLLVQSAGVEDTRKQGCSCLNEHEGEAAKDCPVKVDGELAHAGPCVAEGAEDLHWISSNASAEIAFVLKGITLRNLDKQCC